MDRRYSCVRALIAGLLVQAGIACSGGDDAPATSEAGVGGAKAEGGATTSSNTSVAKGGAKAQGGSVGSEVLASFTGGAKGDTSEAGLGGASTSVQSKGGSSVVASGGTESGGTTNSRKSSGGSSASTKAAGGAVTATGGRSEKPSSGGINAGGQSSGSSSTRSTAAGGKAAGGSSTGTSATGGKATGGASSTTGGKATGGAATGGAATGGTTQSSSAVAVSCNTTLPAYTTSTTVSATITISGTKDYGMQRFCADPNTLGDGNQSESQKPIFMLAKGAVLKNVIIGGSGCSAADGVHCESGSCTLENVWIGDVGEDAITFKGNDSSQVMTIKGGGAFEASDKVIQHNGPGLIVVDGFFVKNAGKLYRSCGNCSTQYKRQIELNNIFASTINSVLVGVNQNYGDTATIKSLTKCGTVKAVCETFTGNNTGDEPTALSTYTTSGDGKSCIFTASNIK